MIDPVTCVLVVGSNGQDELLVEHGFWRSTVRLRNLHNYSQDLKWKGGWVIVYQDDLVYGNIPVDPYRLEDRLAATDYVMKQMVASTVGFRANRS